jgi:hypothetical protein
LGWNYDAPSCFAASEVQDESKTYENKLNRLEEFSDRLKGVKIESLDWTN